MLVRGVWKIKRFFRENNAEDYIDTAMLWRHALSFGLYLVSNVAFFSMLALFSFFPDNRQVDNAFYITQTIYTFVSTLS